MAEMSADAKRELANLVQDWGMLGVLRALADFCGHWSRHYDKSRATESYAHAEISLRALADYLDKITNFS